MQMSISQAAPASTQPQSGGTAVKGTNDNFGQTLVQTLGGAAVVNDQTAANVTQTAQSSQMSQTSQTAGAAAALQSLLNGNVSAADLLAVVEELLSNVDAVDEQNPDSAHSEDELKDVLKQLDDLLALLGGLPQIPVANKTEVSGNTASNVVIKEDNSSLAAIASADVSDKQVSLLASVKEQVSQIETAVTAGSNPETIVTLKADVQDALHDLRSFLQQSKNNSSTRDQLLIIGKQLNVIQQLLNGEKTVASLNTNETRVALKGDTAESMRALQTTVTTNSHLHRMANQLMHVGMLSVVPSKEEQDQLSRQVEQEVTIADGTQVISGNQELQRQIQNTVKPIVQQPVPVQQFAETMQGLVIKQFSLTKTNGVSEARISLYPEHLGQVDVRISVTNGIITAHFLTDTVTAKDMLDNQMAQLRSALQSQGLQVDRLEVSQTADQQSNLFQDRQGRNGQEQQAAKRNKSNDDSIGDVNFSSDLEEIKVEQAVDRVMGLGRGIHTTA